VDEAAPYFGQVKMFLILVSGKSKFHMMILLE
jgi:hypothetical protein